jgi:exonuclease III|tara:strand:- start:1158 stop:1397 length:240 start_codon:yes stop_codon:yes gene_type:complete
MKIISWNCNLNFAKKYDHIEPVDADVIIVQECENLREDYFSGRKFFWTRRIQKKAVINNTSRSKSKKRLTVSRFFDSSD